MASLLGIRRASSSSNKNKAEDKNKNKNTVFCKKHPKHRQSPGVCSICLNEKLSLFIKSASSRRQILRSSSTTSSLSSSYSSSSASSCPSPLLERSRFLLMSGGSGRGEKAISWMMKSRSLACKVDDDEKRKKKKKKKGGKTKSGFFFGLVMGTRRD